MRRLFIAAAALLVAIVALLAGLTLVPDAAISRRLTAAVVEVSGHHLTIEGRSRVVLAPLPVLVAEGVRLKTAGGEELARADSIELHLRLLPLVAGDVEAAEIRLLRALIKLTIDEAGNSAWLPDTGRFGGALRGGSAAALPEVSFEDTTIEIAYGRGLGTELSSVDGSLSWPAATDSLRLDARLVWHGEIVETQFDLGPPGKLRAGQPVPVLLALSAPAISAKLAGELDWRAGLMLRGSLSAKGPSLRSALRLAGTKIGPGAAFSAYRLDAKIRASQDSIQLNDVAAELDGATYSGAVGYDPRVSNTIRATLASKKIDLTPYFGGSRDQEVSQMARSLAEVGTRLPSVDLRVSADTLVAGEATLGPAAAALRLRDRTLSVQLDELRGFGSGLLSGRLDVKQLDEGLQARLEALGKDVDATELTALIGSTQRLEGPLSFDAKLETMGSDLDDILRGLTGQMRFASSKGALVGIDLDQILRRFERAPLTAAAARGGKTPFTRLSGAVTATGSGSAELTEFVLESPTLRVTLGGASDLADRRLALTGTALLWGNAKSDTGERVARFELPFAVEGPWREPRAVPDAASLVRRSDAAAPLFGPLIEKLTGTKAPAAATPPATPR